MALNQLLGVEPQLFKTTVNRCFYINFKNNCIFVFLLQIFVLYLLMFNNKIIEIMKNTVQFLIGFEGDWQDLSFNDNGFTINITDFEQAIRIAKDSGIKNISLRQDDKINGGTLEWDNI